MGVIPKIAKFLGVDKLAKGAASAYRAATGEVNQDIQTQQAGDAAVQKLLYVARNEADPAKKRRLLAMANKLGGSATAEDIDPGLTLSNREIIGSAANTVLNIATPGAFKGGKAAIVAKNAALGGAFGAASGMEKGRNASGIVGSTVGGAAVGAVVGATGIVLKAAKDFATRTTPEWMMNKAVKPALQELKKNVKTGSNTLGKELLDEGVKGSPKRLLTVAQDKLQSFEDELQTALSRFDDDAARTIQKRLPDAQIAELGATINKLDAQFVAKPTPANKKALENAVALYNKSVSDRPTKLISRESIKPYLKELVAQKNKTPGAKDQAKAIEGVLDDLPEEMTLQEANEIKRNLYAELRDVSYKLDAKLSTKAGAMKQIARGLKKEIETATGDAGVREINKKLSIYGRLEDAVVDQMARSMKNNGISLTDAILAAGGVGSMNPVAFAGVLATIVGRHNSTALATRGANILSKGQRIGTGAAGRLIKAGVRRAALNAP